MTRMNRNFETEDNSLKDFSEPIELFKSIHETQILLPENSLALAVETYLQMCRIPYSIQERANVEHMTVPTGEIPFIRVKDNIISGFDSIIQYLNHRGVSYMTEFTNDKHIYMTLVHNNLGNAELYLTWMDELIYKEVTRNRYGSLHPWPLNIFLPWQKQRRVSRKLKALQWSNKTRENVYEEVTNCIQQLSEYLGQKTFFFGNEATELDALLYGHLFTILTTELPDNTLSRIVKLHDNLVSYVKRIDEMYHKCEKEKRAEDNDNVSESLI